MRKILLATTAIVGFAGIAQAAEAPIQVTLGGEVNFRAAMFHESQKLAGPDKRANGDIQTEYAFTIAAEGKAAGGINYGALVEINNDQNQGSSNRQIGLEQAYLWMSGAFGKVVLGDHQGASDLFVFAPTVGEGQIAGKYTNFTDDYTLARFQPAFIDLTETATKVTYFTPKVDLGDRNHSVQLGVSFAPDEDGKGTRTNLYKNDIRGAKNVIEVAAQYSGTFDQVGVTVTPMLVSTESNNASWKWGGGERGGTLWGIGAQATYAGFTLGGSYVDAGKVHAPTGGDDKQRVWTIGLGYEMDKVALAANYMRGKGYDENVWGGDYVNRFAALGFGASYTWFPGLTTAADAVIFSQKIDGWDKNAGHVLMLSQKMAF
ncbi:MAG: porin [Alphaproteobacteria bacterium]|nr:porin [Alphaproteobacteria bacterium]